MILVEQNFNTLIERSEDKKKTYLQGIFMESEVKNRNGRTYQKKEIEGAVKRVNEAAEQKRHILGQLDHPQDLIVNLAEVSHKILQMEMQGNNAIGRAEILENVPKGQIAKGLIDSGIILGMSSRGSGSVNENTGIVEGFNLITVDIVANPSAVNAYPTSVMEALELYRKGQVVNDLAYAVIHDKAAQKYFQKELTKFIQETFNK